MEFHDKSFGSLHGLRSGFSSTIYRHITKGLISAVEPGGLASDGCIAAADDVAVEWVEFNQARDAASAFGS